MIRHSHGPTLPGELAALLVACTVICVLGAAWLGWVVLFSAAVCR